MLGVAITLRRIDGRRRKPRSKKSVAGRAKTTSGCGPAEQAQAELDARKRGT
jgi:hypothetical protein